MNINFNRLNRPPKPEQGAIAQILTAIVGIIILIGAFMFSLVFFGIIAVAGVILWGYFWWKTRAIRQQIRAQMEARSQEGHSAHPFGAASPQSEAPIQGEVIDGEAVRVVDERDRPDA